jgi:hypothetical protein
MKNIIISLFDYSGSWSKPYREAGYEVIQIDIKLGIDILTWDYKGIDKSRVVGVLAAPPCTHFSVSGNKYWEQKDLSGETQKMVALTKKTLEIIKYFNPYFWVLENPVGRIDSLIPELKKLRMMVFDPCDFGDAYTKKTILYGSFNPLLIRNYVKPVRAEFGHHSIDLFLIGRFGKTPFHKRAEMRSITPEGFSYAFFEANNPLNLKSEKVS